MYGSPRSHQHEKQQLDNFKSVWSFPRRIHASCVSKLTVALVSSCLGDRFLGVYIHQHVAAASGLLWQLEVVVDCVHSAFAYC